MLGKNTPTTRSPHSRRRPRRRSSDGGLPGIPSSSSPVSASCPHNALRHEQTVTYRHRQVTVPQLQHVEVCTRHMRPIQHGATAVHTSEITRLKSESCSTSCSVRVAIVIAEMPQVIMQVMRPCLNLLPVP